VTTALYPMLVLSYFHSTEQPLKGSFPGGFDLNVRLADIQLRILTTANTPLDI